MATQDKKIRILAVDDDPTITKLVDKILSAQGYEVTTTSDGLEAMVQVKKNPPDLIILDIMMPEINGYDVCRTLKFDSPYKDIPILILTSRDQEIDPRIGQMMGIHYMQKPFKPEGFLAEIKQMLK